MRAVMRKAEMNPRRIRRSARVLRILALVAVLAVAALVVPGSSVRTPDAELVKLHTGEGVDAGGDVIWILAVGSDARPGQNMLRSRGDALQLIGLNTRTGAASALGIPRDSWVGIPGHGSNRVNAALYFGGPELLGRTVGNLVGVQPDYVFVTRFPFFEAMINEIGGIDVRNPRPFADEYLKPKGFKAGKIHLGPHDAHAFSRIRKSLAAGDFDRSANQQRVLRGIQARVRARADAAGLHREGRADGDPAPAHQPAAERAVRAGPGGGAGRPVEDHHLRAAGRHREHRRRQRGDPVDRAGQAVRQRDPQGRHDQALLTRPAVEVRAKLRPSDGLRASTTDMRRLRQDSNLRHLVPETSALSPELRRPAPTRRDWARLPVETTAKETGTRR